MLRHSSASEAAGCDGLRASKLHLGIGVEAAGLLSTVSVSFARPVKTGARAGLKMQCYAPVGS